MFFLFFLLCLVITNKNFKSSIKICSMDLAKCKLNKLVSMKKILRDLLKLKQNFYSFYFLLFFIGILFLFYK